jgi:hypothetical protein
MIIEVDFIFPGGFTPLLQLRAEDPDLKGGGSHINGKNVSFHIKIPQAKLNYYKQINQM